MVKVCNFSLFEEQKIISPKTGEPLAVTCSNNYMFVAEEGCVLEVYALQSTEPVAQLRTVGPVTELLYNSVGDCIVTLERKTPSSHAFARVYFKWHGSSIDRPMRVRVVGTLAQTLFHGAQNQRASAEIVELPADETSSIFCLACCPDSGCIAIGMGTKIRVFSLKQKGEHGVSQLSAAGSSHVLDTDSPGEATSPSEVTSPTIEVLLDIHTGVFVKKLNLFNDYIAFISSFEARVLKLSFRDNPVLVSSGCGLVSQANSSTAEVESDICSATPTGADPSEPEQPRQQLIDREKESKIKSFGNCVNWSPSKVWESECMSASLSADSLSLSRDAEPHPLYTSLSNRVCQKSLPYVETLSLPCITDATQQRTSDRHPMEVLGPVEYVWGQPIEVELEEDTLTKCRVLTMLYRRFPLPLIESADSFVHIKSTSTLPPQFGRSLKQEGDEFGLHSVQLIPSRVQGFQKVIGLSCFIGSKFHGYLYDVIQKTRLISSLSFMSPTRTVVADNCFIHALSDDSVETFSNRALQAALSNKSLSSSSIHANAQWIKQPCPNPSMDVTLMSSNMFIGGCCLATNRNHLIVLTKSKDPQQQSSSNWLLQSLAGLRTISEATWNIYILTMKDPLSLYQQLVEYSDSVKDTSPPMYQHVISEGHVLLRSQLLLNGHLSEGVCKELSRTLSKNSFLLADSLCLYARGPKHMVTTAAQYFIMSGASPTAVVQHITSSYSKENSLPYKVLMKYLGLVLAASQSAGQSASQSAGQSTSQSACQSEELAAIADTVLDLYAEFNPKQLGQVLLTSSLRQLSPDHALSLLNTCLSGSPRSHNSLRDDICQLILLLEMDREGEAIGKLKELSEDSLTGWLKDHLRFLIEPEDSQLSRLGKILRVHRENCLLNVLYFSLTSKQLDFTYICELLECGRGQELCDNTILKAFLEKIILDCQEYTHRVSHEAVLLLVEVLIARLNSTQLIRPSFTSPFSLYGNRYKWLDSFPPFDGSTDTHLFNQTVLKDLMQLQALLCTQHMFPVSQVASHVEVLLEECADTLIGSLSLKVLTWPHTGKIQQATLLTLEKAPLVTIDFALSYFPPLLPSWENLLSILVDHIQRSGQRSEELLQPIEIYKQLYKAALRHVVTITTTEEFLSLLPLSGSLEFFLPLIECSCHAHITSHLAHQLHTNCLTR